MLVTRVGTALSGQMADPSPLGVEPGVQWAQLRPGRGPVTAGVPEW
jgi:hypothetical protein